MTSVSSVSAQDTDGQGGAEERGDFDVLRPGFQDRPLGSVPSLVKQLNESLQVVARATSISVSDLRTGSAWAGPEGARRAAFLGLQGDFCLCSRLSLSAFRPVHASTSCGALSHFEAPLCLLVP